MAASKSAVKVSGVRELQTALRKLEAEAADLKTAHKAVAETLVPGIRGRTPVRSGALALGWQAGATKGRARITSSQRYAGVIEYGHPKRNIEPASMIGETVAASHTEILETYERELGRLAARLDFDVKDT